MRKEQKLSFKVGTVFALAINVPTDSDRFVQIATRMTILLIGYGSTQ